MISTIQSQIVPMMFTKVFNNAMLFASVNNSGKFCGSSP